MAGAGDKTEAPTAKKKRDARKKGNVARSPELVTWGGLLVMSFVVPVAFGLAADQVMDVVNSMTHAIENPEPQAALAMLGEGFRAMLIGVAPIGLAMVAWALVSN